MRLVRADAAAYLEGEPAGSFDGFRITYTPGASLGFAGGVGLVDEGGGRLLSSYERGM